MKGKIILIALLQSVWATGFSQSLSLQKFGDSFQRTNLDVRWETSTNSLPRIAWIYRLLPKTFSPAAISNLVAQCGFTERDITTSNGNVVVYKTAGKHPEKQLELSHGSLFYTASTHYGPTNLTKDLPEMSRMSEVTSNFLAKLGIGISDIEKDANGSPNFHFFQPVTEYFLPDQIVTNIEFRGVRFSRAVDGATILGAGTAGDGEIFFGEHGNPVHIDLSWRDLERIKSCPTVTRETIIKWIREGKAVQGGIPMNLPDIDWASVKSLTVKKADLCYYAGDRMAPSAWLMPLVSLWTTVDTGNGNVDVEIDCPIIDETKP
jgi:hypothetical protein